MIKIKKIVFFTTRYPFYTVGENFFESELEGISQGYDEVYVVACDSNLKNPVVKKNLPENVTAIHLKSGNRKLNLFKACLKLPFTKLFWREFRQFRSEKLPLLSSLKTLIYAGSIYFAICRNFPIVKKSINLSDDDELTLMGYWLHYVSLSALKFRDYIKRPEARVVSRAHGSADIQNLTRPLRFYPFRQHLLNNLDGIFAISDKGRDYLRSLSSRPEIISRVYIGSYGSDKFIEHKRAPFTVVSCSFLVPLKRVELIAKAISILSEDYPNIRWVHFGDGPCRKSLEKACANIKENVDLRGHTPHDEVLKFLSSGKASLFVHASASEGLPVSVMEALGYSLPVVATDVNATCEAVVTSVTGTLISPDIDAQQLADYIRKYIEMDDQGYLSICKSTFEFWQSALNCKENSKLLLEGLNQL